MTVSAEHWALAQEPVGGAVTFGLCLLTVGRNDDALQLPELQVLQDFPQPQHEPAFGLGLDRILLVHPVLEAHQFLEQPRDTSIYFFTKHLAAVAERSRGTGDADSSTRQEHATPDKPVTQRLDAALYYRERCYGGPALHALCTPYLASLLCHPALNTHLDR